MKNKINYSKLLKNNFCYMPYVVALYIFSFCATLMASEKTLHEVNFLNESGIIENLKKGVKFINPFLSLENNLPHGTLKEENPLLEPYGGSKGNEYFQKITNNTIIPFLEDSLRDIQRASKDCHSDFLKLIVDLGQKRKEIALETNTKHSSKFGERILKDFLCDRINLRALNLREALTENIINMLDQFFSKTKAYSLEKNKINIEYISDVLEIFTENNENENGDLFFKTEYVKNFSLARLSDQPSFFYRILFGNMDEDGSVGEIEFIIKKLYAPLNIKNYISSLGHHTQVIIGAEKDLFEQSPIEAKIWHSAATNENLEYLSYDFEKALSYSATEKEKLSKKLGRFYFYFNHASIYRRGQASVGEWLVKAMAGVHGYDLSWDSSWMPPNMSASEHALLIFDKEDYISSFCEKTMLTERSKRN